MSQNDSSAYRVLARKYRPQHLDELIGQETLVRTLKNAITSGRLAQAYILTGVRGVGKTTTARIIARAINYTGPDGTSGPTTGPTDDCALCRAIAEDRHPDVIEMDAASHTGVDDVRDIIESVRYAPAEARYKVYIIDEVHMLSKSAFNALLKTLEEPPPHAKFIFATTEIRKVPITILSRCQRFDLRRVDEDTLTNYFAKICGLENVAVEIPALRAIARAAGGSVRDGLSLLDQAMALGQGEVKTETVEGMLGLVDQSRIADLLAAAMSGKTPEALAQLSDLDRLGAEAGIVMDDLLALTHTLMKAKVCSTLEAVEPQAARDLGQQAGIPALGRAWQILLRSLQDVAAAPNPMQAAEMAIIRLAYAADFPDPGKLIKDLQGGVTLSGGGARSGAAASASAGAPTALRAIAGGGSIPLPAPSPSEKVAVALHTIEDLVNALEQDGQMILASTVAHYVQLVRLEPGKLEFCPAPAAPQRLAQDLKAALEGLTDSSWLVALSRTGGEPTWQEQRAARNAAREAEILAHPQVAAIVALFPGTTIESIETKN